MSYSNDVIRVAAMAAGNVMVSAKGNPANVVAVGVAAAVTFVGTGIGYGLYKGGEYLIDKVRRSQAD